MGLTVVDFDILKKLERKNMIYRLVTSRPQKVLQASCAWSLSWDVGPEAWSLGVVFADRKDEPSRLGGQVQECCGLDRG